jgi:hypothetical protein
MVIKDADDILRELIEEWHEIAYSEGLGRPDGKDRAFVALDALVADAAMKERALTDYFADASRRAEAAEAERDLLAEVAAAGNEREKLLEAEVARLREAQS